MTSPPGSTAGTGRRAEQTETGFEVDHDCAFDNDLDSDEADEELDGTELVDLSWQQIHDGGPASSASGGIQLILVSPGLARSVPYGDIDMGWLATSVQLDREPPEAYARDVAQWIRSSVDDVLDLGRDLISQVDYDEEQLEEAEDSTSVTAYISAACPQQALKAELADLNEEHVQIVWCHDPHTSRPPEAPASAFPGAQAGDSTGRPRVRAESQRRLS